MRPWLARCLALAEPSGRLFPQSPAALSRWLASATAPLVSGYRLTWHSLRRGGATFLHHQGWSKQDIADYGLWRSLDALKHYVLPWAPAP